MTKKRTVLTSFGVTLLFLLAFSAFMGINFHMVEVRGESMVPTLRNGQRVLMSKAYWLVGPVQLNDVVVLRNPVEGETFIKRVVGLGGDVIDFELVPSSWNLGMGEYRVASGMVYVVGDNRPVSEDSRALGPFEPSNIMGKVVVFKREPWMIGLLAVGGVAAALAVAIRIVTNRGERA